MVAMPKLLAALLTFGLCVVFSWSAKGAHAQSDDAKQQAFDLFEQSKQAYQQGNYLKSSQLLRQAYALEPDPILLYNLGRSLDSLGDLQGAVNAYRSYLDSKPGPEETQEIREKVDQIQRQIELRKRREEQQGDRDRVTLQQGLSSESKGQDESKNVSPWPWVVIGVGIAALASAIGVGIAAQNKHNEAVMEPVQQEAFALQNQADSLATASTALFVGGGIVAAGGATWAIIDLFSSSKSEKHQR